MSINWTLIYKLTISLIQWINPVVMRRPERKWKSRSEILAPHNHLHSNNSLFNSSPSMDRMPYQPSPSNSNLRTNFLRIGGKIRRVWNYSHILVFTRMMNFRHLTQTLAHTSISWTMVSKRNWTETWIRWLAVHLCRTAIPSYSLILWPHPMMKWRPKADMGKMPFKSCISRPSS